LDRLPLAVILERPKKQQMNIIKKNFTILIALTFISFVTKGQKLKDPDVFLVPNKDSLPKIFRYFSF
jgi:hypothetical protein